MARLTCSAPSSTRPSTTTISRWQGVTASLTTDATCTTITDAQGAFTLYLDPGTSAVNLSLSGFATTTLASFTAPSNGSIDTGITRLKRVLSGPMGVTGRVITAAGTAVPGATGSVEGYEGTFTTDASGNYGFTAPALWLYRLTFTKAGFPTRTDDTFVFISVNVTSILTDFVLDTVARPVLAGIIVGPNPVVGGTTASLHLTLSAPAPSGGATVSLVFSGQPTGPHSYATLPAGALFTDFSLTTNVVGAPASTVVTAFYGGVQLATTLNVIPATGVLTSVAVSPTSVFGGSLSTGTVTLNGPAPAGGVVVTLSSNDSAASVPSSVTVPQGGTSATFTITTSGVATTHTATITAVYGYSRTASLTVNPAPPATLIGVAPGWVLPGDTTPVLYGSNIQPGSTVTFTGPVYSLTDFQNQLCTPGGTCPTSTLAATVDVGGAYALFAIPPGASPGIYQLRVRSAAGIDSTNNQWIGVDSAQRSLAALTADEHDYATRIYPGQTVTGTFTGNFPLNGISDYNFYYFVATAGTHVDVTMQRVDTSLPWENAASLDPQIEVIAPDGFVYANLQGFDDVPGNNLNSSITGAILPQTGVYLIAAETTRGAGQYQLSLNLSAVAAASTGSRVVALSGNGATVPLGRAVSANALMLDPRGYPLAGADVTFAVVPDSDDTGALGFVGGPAVQTSLQGIAVRSAQITAAGKVRFRPSFTNSFFSNATYTLPSEPAASSSSAADDERLIPLYRPVARRPFSILGVGANRIGLSAAAFTRLAPEPIATRQSESGTLSPSTVRSALAKTAVSSSGGLSPTPSTERRPLPKPLAYARLPLAITGCAADLSLFVEAGVDVREVYPPFTVTLTDMTPPTGGGAANRTIDFQGIRDHRIEKKVRIKMDIKDGHGATPDYPVLVELAVGGPRHGSLILDPDGAMVTCSEASFLWHETGGTSNEQFDYELGTLSLYAGLTKDSAGAYKPVWDEAETLGMRISTIDTGGTQIQWENSWAAHPEPGKPDHFACYQPDGTACPDTFRFWSGYLAFSDGGHLATSPYYSYTVYELDDRYNNKTYGYSTASMTAPAPNVTTQFFDQLPGTPFVLSYIPTSSYGHYGFVSSWTNVPAWPNGNLYSTLRVDYGSDPDGDWPSGWVNKDITFQFEDTNSHALIESKTYDLVKPDGSKGVTDGTFPMLVRPGLAAANMPKTEAGDTRRLTLLIVSGNVTRSDSYYAEPYGAGTRFWTPSGSRFNSAGSVARPEDRAHGHAGISHQPDRLGRYPRDGRLLVPGLQVPEVRPRIPGTRLLDGAGRQRERTRRQLPRERERRLSRLRRHRAHEGAARDGRILRQDRVARSELSRQAAGRLQRVEVGCSERRMDRSLLDRRRRRTGIELQLRGM